MITVILVIPCLFMQYEQNINGLGSYHMRPHPECDTNQDH